MSEDVQDSLSSSGEPLHEEGTAWPDTTRPDRDDPDGSHQGIEAVAAPTESELRAELARLQARQREIQTQLRVIAPPQHQEHTEVELPHRPMRIDLVENPDGSITAHREDGATWEYYDGHGHQYPDPSHPGFEV